MTFDQTCQEEEEVVVYFYKVADIVKLTCPKLQKNPGTKVKTSDLAHQSVSLFSLWESSLMLSNCAELPAPSPVSAHAAIVS